MMQTRKIGNATVSHVIEYSAPTHDPAFLFPQLAPEDLTALADRLAPHHFIPSMNRLIVTIQIWIVQVADKIILIDTGVGNGKTRTAARMHQLNNRVPEWLQAAGASFDKVTHVVQTHLHADHTGWNTVQKDGRWVPAFPNARYLFPKTDYDHLAAAPRDGSDMTMDRSWEDSVLPVVEAGLVDFVADDAGVILDCLEVEPVPGHTIGMLSYRLRSEDEEGLFCGDVFHSPVQIMRPDINTAYCQLQDIARSTRLRVLNEAADRKTLIMPMHLGAPYCGYISRNEAGFEFEPAAWT